MKTKHFEEAERQFATTDGAEGASIRWLLGPEDGMPNFYLRYVEVEPGGMTMHHKHPYEHEVFVLEGVGELINEGENCYELSPGRAAYVAPGEIHQFINTGDGPFKFLCMIPKTE